MDDMRDRIVALAKRRKNDCVEFLQELIAIPSQSGQEEQIAMLVRQRMLDLGFDRVDVDRLGNVIGTVGEDTNPLILFDAHMDTRNPGDRASWRFDPYRGDFKAGKVYGHGAAKNKGGLAAMVYAGAIMKELDLCIDGSAMFVASVQGVECEGLAYKSLFEVEGIKPYFVMLTAPTGLRLHRGQRGRAEISVALRGEAVHASSPGKSFNSLYGLAEVIKNVEALNSKMKKDPVLGAASIAVTHIECDDNGTETLPESARIVIDRRLLPGDIDKKILQEINQAAKGTKAKIDIVEHENPSYRGLRLPIQKFFPAWMTDTKSELTMAAESAYESLFRKEPAFGLWNMSTAGVYTQGIADIPTLGMGPGEESHSTPINDHCKIDELEKAMAFYAVLMGHLPEKESKGRRR